MENAKKNNSRNHPVDGTARAGKAHAGKASDRFSEDSAAAKTSVKAAGRNSAGNKTNGAPAKDSSAGGLRRAVAIIAIVLLAGLYLVTFVLAIAGNEHSAGMFRFCFGMTIFVPLFAWVMIWCIGYLWHKKSMASLNLFDSNPEERERMEQAIAREMNKENRVGK